MKYCKNCKELKGSGEIVCLSNGCFVHKECLDLINNDKLNIENNIQHFENEIDYQNRLIDEKETWLSFFANLFFGAKQPDVSEEKFEIDKLNKNIEFEKKHLKDVQNKLACIYDFYCEYPPDWELRKEKVSERDGDYCSKCGDYSHLHLHHIDKLSRGGTNELENLILLCSNCHSEEHGGRKFDGDFSNKETAYSKNIRLINMALETGETIEFLYKKAGELNFNKRSIIPEELIEYDYRHSPGSSLCIRGFCHLRSENRTFAISRMKAMKIISA